VISYSGKPILHNLLYTVMDVSVLFLYLLITIQEFAHGRVTAKN